MMLERRKEKELLEKSTQIHEEKNKQRIEYKIERLLFKEAGIHHFKRRQGRAYRYHASEGVDLAVTRVGVVF